MAINKDKNVLIQITFPKEDAENLEALKNAYEKQGIKVSKSEILKVAFKDYLKMLFACSTIEQKDKGGNNDA